MDYKDTLLMPNTEFEMRGNLPQKEPLYLARWEAEEHYQRLLETHAQDPLFVLHDGPPYANGNLHSGTAMNRILKDIVVRSHAMSGYLTPFIPGWDTHGLPIENAVIKQGINRKEVEAAVFRAYCEKYAKEQIEIQKATMKRLGTVADYDNPYITLTHDFEANQIQSFAKMALDGLIYQGLKPVYWSPASESALAESEIVYIDKKDPTIYVAFPVNDGKGVLEGDEQFVIWTTTPWTIPANLAICLNPSLTYAVVETEKGKLIVLEKHIASLMEKFELTNYKTVKTFKGKELEGITVTHPLYPERTSLIILGDYVTDEDGSGCVHTAPGHGVDDFYAGQKYKLPAFCPVDEQGCMTEEAGDWLKGQFVDDANKTITQRLEQLGVLLKLEWITHSYPHDERMKKPIIFRATVQWFASLDKIREELLDQIKNVNWLNEWGEVRLYNMIKEREDWCISRQRLWGLPIPIIYNEDKTPIMEKEVFDHISDLFRQHGSNVWFESEAKDLLPEGYSHPHSPNGLFTKETDIMDVWFDSGSTHNVLVSRGLPYPADLYFEGSDQYRGWFNSSLIVGTALHHQAPYKSVISHGYVLDAKGEKMSKSVGNTIDPLDIVAKYGVDILRLWCANIDFKQDVRIGDDILKQVADQYRKIRNTFRFMLGNINESDFNPKTDLFDYNELTEVDQHILILLEDVNATVQQAYLDYDYLEVSNTLSIFMSNILSAYYLDFTKDILYIEKKDSKRRRQVQSTIYHLVHKLVALWAPILAFTSEEVYDYLKEEETASIHRKTFPEELAYESAHQLKNDFNELFAVRDDVMKAMEEARNEKVIGKPLEAHIKIVLDEKQKALVEQLLKGYFAQWLTVSKVSLVEHASGEYKVSKIDVVSAEGSVCPRCWNITEEGDENGLCPRCQEVLK